MAFRNRLDRFGRAVPSGKGWSSDPIVSLSPVVDKSSGRFAILGGLVSAETGKFLLPCSLTIIDGSQLRRLGEGIDQIGPAEPERYAFDAKGLLLCHPHEVLGEAAGIVHYRGKGEKGYLFLFTPEGLGSALAQASSFGACLEKVKRTEGRPFTNLCPASSVLALMVLSVVLNKCYDGSNPCFNGVEALGISSFSAADRKVPVFKLGLAVRDENYLPPESFRSCVKVLEHLHTVELEMGRSGVPSLNWVKFKESILTN